MSTTTPFLDRLRQGPLLCDGAMGTMLYSRLHENSLHGRCFDELVLTRPEMVQDVHLQYIRAGAQVIETNTFGANAAKLAAYGLEGQVAAINRRAAKLAYEARDIAGVPVYVAGAVGPTGLPAVRASSDDEQPLRAIRALFRAQIEALVEGGADLLILETFSNLAELRQAALAARDATDLPIIAQMTFDEDIQSASGNTPFEAAAVLAELGADVIGVNCSIGPNGTLDAVEQMLVALRTLRPSATDTILLSAQPNAGLPTRVENRFLYVSTPAYFAEYARRFAAAGVRLIGGCCGTTPAHIAAMRGALAEQLPADAPALWAAPALVTREPAEAELPAEEAPVTRLRRALDAGRFVVSVELDPPKGLNPGKVVDGAAYLKRRGVEFINIGDSPMARARMSSLALARLLHDQLDLETVIHFTTRDRNMMAIQADLLGAHALGIHNVLALTGDPVRAGNYPNLTGVWDVDSVGLIGVLHGMNEGRDAAGAALGSVAAFHIGAALNLNMEDAVIDVDRERVRRKLGGDPADSGSHHAGLTETELELRRLRAKLDAGAQFIMTQPIYDLEPLERFCATFGPVEVPLILGVMPLHSSRHAEYLHNEVPGITIPDQVRERMREAGDHGRDVGLELARDVVTEARARGLIAGCYMAPSYGRYDLVGELAQELLRAEATAARAE